MLLKPCPFCGEKEKVKIVAAGRTTVRWVMCSHCGAVGGAGRSEQEAAFIWNSRAYENEAVR